MGTQSDRATSRAFGGRRRYALLAVTIVLGFVASVFVGMAYGSTDTKPYRVVITPSPVAKGSSSTFSVTIYNDAKTQSLGSANVTPPSGFAATRAGPADKATLVGNTVQLRNLEIPAKQNRTYTVTASVPCSGTGGTWSVIAKQANNFSGTGNDFTFSAAGSSLTTATNGTCHLDFVTQAGDAEKGATISSTNFNTPPGMAVKVGVFDGNNNLVTGSTVAITVAIAPDSPDPDPTAVLSGALSKNAVAGVASFGDLAISQHGIYKLRATSPNLTPATSGAFQIWDDVTECPADTGCTSTSGISGFQTSFSGTSTTDGFLVTTVGQDALDCGDTFRHAPAVVTGTTYNFNATDFKTLVNVVDKSTVFSPPAPGTYPFFWVCFESDKDLSYPNGLEVPAFTPFLLPDCFTSEGTAPCVQSIVVNASGDLVETLRLPKDDIFRVR